MIRHLATGSDPWQKALRLLFSVRIRGQSDLEIKISVGFFVQFRHTQKVIMVPPHDFAHGTVREMQSPDLPCRVRRHWKLFDLCVHVINFARRLANRIDPVNVFV
jgi:hypothetical protein